MDDVHEQCLLFEGEHSQDLEYTELYNGVTNLLVTCSDPYLRVLSSIRPQIKFDPSDVPWFHIPYFDQSTQIYVVM